MDPISINHMKLWNIVMRSFFPKFLICQLHSLIFQNIELIIHQTKYWICTCAVAGTSSFSKMNLTLLLDLLYGRKHTIAPDKNQQLKRLFPCIWSCGSFTQNTRSTILLLKTFRKWGSTSPNQLNILKRKTIPHMNHALFQSCKHFSFLFDP